MPNTSAITPRSPPMAVIVPAEGDDADTLLLHFANDLRSVGWRVRGLVQPPRLPGREKQMLLLDLDDADARYDIFQPLGSGACGCRLDPAGIAAASVVLRRALTDGADLVLANRFGTLEAGGGGLAAEMLALMVEDVPLLTVINPRYLPAWRDFSGGLGAELPPRADALQAWFTRLEHTRQQLRMHCDRGQPA